MKNENIYQNEEVFGKIKELKRYGRMTTPTVSIRTQRQPLCAVSLINYVSCLSKNAFYENKQEKSCIYLISWHLIVY